MSDIEKNYPFVTIEGNEVFLKPFLSFHKRKIGELNSNEIETLSNLKLEFDKFEKKVNEVFQKIENTENKGSFLVQLENFKKQIETINVSGNLEEIFTKLEQYEQQIKQQIEVNRTRNLEIKKALLEEAKILSESKNWHKASEEIKDLKLRWLKTGAVISEKKEELENSFQAYLNHFYSQKNELLENTQEHIDTYKKLIEQAKSKLEATLSKEIGEEMKAIQHQWNELPPIPKIQYNILHNEFIDVQNKFFNNFKKWIGQQRKHLNDEKQQKSIDLKINLIEKVKYLYQKIEDNHFDTITQLREEWKKSGIISPEKSEKFWDDFNYQIEKLLETQKLHKIEKNLLKNNSNTKKETIFIEKEKYLKKAIRIEKENLEKMTTNLGSFRINHKSTDFAQVMDSKTRMQERKLKVKQELLKLLN